MRFDAHSEFKPDKAFGLSVNQAYDVMQYMLHLYRMEDIDCVLSNCKQYNNLSKGEQLSVLDEAAYDVDDRLGDISEWYDVARDVVKELGFREVDVDEEA